VAAKFFQALGNAGINVRAIAQGSSERNISSVIDGNQATRALRAVHSSFYLSHQTLSIGVIGSGLIGATLLDQLHQQAERLRKDFHIDLRVRGILTSKNMCLGEPQIDLRHWRDPLKAGTKPDWEKFLAHIQPDHLPHSVLVDATASDELPERYAGWLEKGFHLVTPNKKGNSGTLEMYRTLQKVARAHNRHYLYATTVGAGLPVINTLRDLVQTGDEVRSIEGVLSGTLSFIFNSFNAQKKFSEIVREARQKGYTEPDPREDLSGMDVARKLVILAREMGLPLELKNIEVENLVGERARGGSVDEWLSRLPEEDGAMEALRTKAASANECLRYVGSIQPGGKSAVQLRHIPKDQPFATLSHSDNMVIFRTARYHQQPLIVRGPGAGPEVTAAGVFADLLRLTAYLGGKA
jgi:aspartokinase/homoserine dehydrogenase 1